MPHPDDRATVRRQRVAAVALAPVLALMVLAPKMQAQGHTDTLAVLTSVGHHYRLTATPPWVILADSPRRAVGIRSSVLALPDSVDDRPPAVAGYEVPSIAPRLARMLMAGTGPVRLLARAPETPCDSAAMDPSAGIARPWIGSSIRVTSLEIHEASAAVVAQVDDGTHPCRSMREVGWWRYRLERLAGQWSVSAVERLESGRPPRR